MPLNVQRKNCFELLNLRLNCEIVALYWRMDYFRRERTTLEWAGQDQAPEIIESKYCTENAGVNPVSILEDLDQRAPIEDLVH